MTETPHDNYLLFQVGVERADAETVEAVLLELGAYSCTLEDATDTPIHEPAPGEAPLWNQLVVTGMFAEDTQSELLAAALRNQVDFTREPEFTVKVLAGREWERAWMEDYKPQRVDDRLWVVPSFCQAPDPQAINLAIDPGLAFGSGTHATTLLCLKWLSSHDLRNATVIDYGCGSGILAVAAARLGAEKVYAFDIDPQALTATLENAERNNVAERIRICHSDRELDEPVDFLVANILLSPLLDLSARFAELLQSEGRLGLSGVLAEQVATLANVYAREFQHCKTEMLDQWVLYSAIKQTTIQT